MSDVTRFVVPREGQFVDIPLDIVDFHHKFGLKYEGPPRLILPGDMPRFRLNFMQEELDEYMEALQIGNAEKAFDALIDLTYVAVGTAYMHGFPFAEGWRRVQEANMAKQRCERAKDSTRGSTFDIIKPKGWVAPDLSDLV